MSPGAHDPGVFVLHLEGRNEGFKAELLRGELAAALEARRTVVLDLSGVTSLDRSALRVILDGIARCEEQGRACVLLVPEGCAPEVRARFYDKELACLLPVARTWEDALRRARLLAPLQTATAALH